MLGNKLEQQIIGIFNRDITTLLSINQISKKLGKSYPYINKKVNELIDQNVLKKVEVGRSYLCSINLRNDKAIALLMLNEAEKKTKIRKKISEKTFQNVQKIKKEFKIYTILYYKGLHFVLDHVYDKEAIKAGYPELDKLNLNFYSKSEFFDVLLEEESLLKNKTVIYAAQKYYELIEEISPQLYAQYSKLVPG